MINIRLTAKAKLRYLILAAVMLLQSGPTALAFDPGLYSESNIWSYRSGDKTCQVAQAGTLLTGDVERDLFRFLSTHQISWNDNNPMNLAQIAGVFGNVEIESTFDPAAVNPSSGAFGLFQWLGTRKQQLEDLAAREGLEPESVRAQLLHLQNELDTWEGQNLFNSDFKSASTPEEAARWFDEKFERSEGTKVPERQEAARRYYDRFQSSEFTASTWGSAPYTQTLLANHDGVPAQISLASNMVCSSQSRSAGEYVIYQQCYGQWNSLPYSGGNICTHGCGPAAIANIAANMAGKTIGQYNPAIAATDARRVGAEDPEAGSITSTIADKIAPELGLRPERLATGLAAGTLSGKEQAQNLINAALDAGAMIYVSGRGPKPASNAGHIFVIAGRADDGRWIILDSSSRSASWVQPGENNDDADPGGDLYEQSAVMEVLHHDVTAIYPSDSTIGI